MTIPSRGEVYARLIHHLGEAQSCAATISHLHSLQMDGLNSVVEAGHAKAWMIISEQLKRFSAQVTDIAKGGLVQ